MIHNYLVEQYHNIITNLLHHAEPELAHNIAIKCLRNLYTPKIEIDKSILEGLSLNINNIAFDHPIGLAGGFDKHAEVFDKLGLFGFRFVEIGSVVTNPKYGNPKPRIFRLKEYYAIINRYGFNSKGLDYACKNIQSLSANSILGLSMGKMLNLSI